MVNQLKLIIIVAIISTTIPTITAFVLHDMQEQSVQEELQQLRTQNDILKDTLDDQQKQTEIMNQSIIDFQKSLEKESLISVKVIPYVEDLYNPFDVGFKIQAGKSFVREIFPIKRTIPLKADETVKFDIVITNTGSDTAILNSYDVEVITHYGETFANSMVVYHRDIREPLTAGSLPKIISFNLDVESKFAPRGEIFFIVVHDNGIDESYSLPYFYDE